jgi:hypothetical protein
MDDRPRRRRRGRCCRGHLRLVQPLLGRHDMSSSANPTATNDVLIITTRSVRGDEPTLELSRDDLCQDARAEDDAERPERAE